MAMKQADAVATGQKEEGQLGQSREGTQQAQGAQDDRARRGAQAEEGRSRQDSRIARRDAFTFMSPFGLLQRFFRDDVADLLDAFGSRRAGMPSQSVATTNDLLSWSPKIDVVQRGNELIIRADLPGVNPDDVVVEIGDNAITVSGERRQEHTEEHGSIYRFERAYGTFFREIPLPEGAIADQAKARFKEGVLEIRVPAPPEQVARGRRLEISRDEDTKKSDKDDNRNPTAR
jgi:HSP20 family protein